MQVMYDNARPERLKCPDHYQERLNQVGGLNRYGEPNFRMVWAQTETTWQGGHWSNEDEEFTGYKQVYKGDGLPHWMLMQWIDAGKSIDMPHLKPQSAAAFYVENMCPETGLCILGPYPYHGSYQIALPLLAKVVQNDKLYIEAFPLSTEVIEMMVPVIKAAMEVSIEAKMKFLKECELKEEEEKTKTYEDLYRSIRRNPNLAATDWLENKQRSIEKAANASFLTMLNRNRFFQRNSQL